MVSPSHWLISRVSHYLSKEKPKKPSYLCDFDRICHEVRPADVLLIEGTNRISRIIQQLTHSAWTHAILYIGRLHDIDDPHIREHIHQHYQGKLSDQLIIESIIGKGTIISPISEYKNDHIRICRPTGLTHQDAQKIISFSSKSLGKNYSLRHIIDLARFFLMGRFLPKRWRQSLFNYCPGKATEDICSAMIADAFAHIRFPILPLVRESKNKTLEVIRRNPRLFAPSDFDYSPYFDIIKYPVFVLKDLSSYRELPWNEKLMSNDINLVDSSDYDSKSS